MKFGMTIGSYNLKELFILITFHSNEYFESKNAFRL